MEKGMTHSKSFCFLVSLLLLFFAPVSINAQSENIANSGFETGNLSPWIYVGAGVTPPPDIVTNTVAHEGSYSLKIGGYTACIVSQEFSPSVLPSGFFSFWVLIPSVIDPCIPPEECYPGFNVTIKYLGSEENSSLLSELTGTGWKKIDIPVNQTKEIQAITFTTAHISNLFIDEVSLPSVSPAINLEKKTNDLDADTSPGPSVRVGENVTWTYTVTNTGDVGLTDILLTDDLEGTISCPGNILVPAETMVCTKTGLAVKGQYTNIGTVTGKPLGGLSDVTDTDMSHYFGMTSETSSSPWTIFLPPIIGKPVLGNE